MKHRASLTLMEQLIMVLIFALAAAVCLGIFAKADAISRETARKEEAVVLAQNAAELLKHTGDPEQVRRQLNTGAFTLVIREKKTALPGLAEAEIVILLEEQALVRLETGWQEVAP